MSTTNNVTIDQIRATVDQLNTQLAQYASQEEEKGQIFAKNMGAKGSLEAIESAVNELQKGDKGEDADVDGMGIDIVTQVMLKKQRELDAIKDSLNIVKGIKELLKIVGTPFGKRN